MATLDDLEGWLAKVADYTRESRQFLEQISKRGGGGSGTGNPNASSLGPDATRFERAMEALGKRFESTLSRWSRTPVEVLIHRGFDSTVRRLDAAASTMINQSRGLIARGLSGTLEQARLDYSLELLGRQFAAIFSPIINGFTYLAARLEPMLRQLNGSEQNRLFGAGIGAVAGSRFGPLGALAGWTLGSGLMGDGTNRLAAMGAGAFIGGRLAGPIGAGIGATAAEVTMSGDYGRARAGGASEERAAAEATARSYSFAPGAGIAARISRSIFGGGSDSFIDPVASAVGRALSPEKDKRRDVTPFQSQMGEAGSTAMRVQEALIRTTAGAGFEEAGPLKPIMDALIEIIKLLARIAGVELVEPRSAESVR